MSVSGSFYPDDDKELKRYFSHFDGLYNQHFKKTQLNPVALIVPHAGYVYSGYTASVAYKSLPNYDVMTYVIIGPSHKIAFDGVSICEADIYKTPLGNIQSDTTFKDELKNKFNLKNTQEAHREHSTETQFPFIKHYQKNAKIIELVYSNIDAQKLSKIIDYILNKKNTNVIISTDLSHFYNEQDARQLDDICLNAIKNQDFKILHSGCEACGKKGVEALMLSAMNLDLKYKFLDYRTSADFSQDESSVVGYMSALFY